MPIAIVSGTSRGLGAVLAQGLRQAGYLVPDLSTKNCDIRSSESVSAFVNDLLPQCGSIDVLVNNAAVLGPVGALEGTSPNEWGDVFAVNVLGAMNLTAAVLPSMKAAYRGAILNIAGGGATGPLPRRTVYAATKAALVRLTESVAEEAKGYGIAVNAVLPGPMPTDMLGDILAAGPEALGESEHVEHSAVTDASAIERAADLCMHLIQTRGLTGRTISARYDPWPFDAEAIKRIMASDLYTLRRVDGPSRQ